MELPTWKGAYCPRHVNPLSMRLFNLAWGARTMCLMKFANILYTMMLLSRTIDLVKKKWLIEALDHSKFCESMSSSKLCRGR